MLSSQETLLREVITQVEELLTGSGITSRDTDVLGADSLPSVLETGELKDL